MDLDRQTASWKTVFHDPMTDDWRTNWFLDGEAATIISGPEGLELHAGPEYLNDAHHAVLWTERDFRGNLRIHYEFTRLDSEVQNVNILYIHATGSGTGPFATDIRTWNHLRREPAMRLYFNHMHAYHVSYAAWEHGNTDGANDYIRARRYMPNATGLEGTELPPAFHGTGLFETGVPHQITAVLRDGVLHFRVRNAQTDRVATWETQAFPACTEGRIGLRLMYTRKSRFRDFRVMQPVN